MNQEHSVIFIPGLGDQVRPLEISTNHWRNRGLNPIVYSLGWRDSEKLFEPKLERLLAVIDGLHNDGHFVSLVGTSAGGSAALNAFVERKNSINGVINVCGRLRTGPTSGYRSFEAKTATSPSFAESVKLFESRENLLDENDRLKVLTVKAMFGDELVPSETAVITGANNLSIPTIEHRFSISMALTLFSILLFIF